MKCTCRIEKAVYPNEDADDKIVKCQLCKAAPDFYEACKQVQPMAQTLMDELAKKRATNWAIVNECLVAVAKAILKAEGHD